MGAGGLGCEPASAASVAGAKRLVAEGVIGRDERVVCILTGHQLKDPTATVAYHAADQQKFDEVLGSRGVRQAAFANRAVAVANDLDAIIKAIQTISVSLQAQPDAAPESLLSPESTESTDPLTHVHLRIAIHGAAGRMGRRLVALAAADPNCRSSRPWIRAGPSALGRRRRACWPASGRWASPLRPTDGRADVVIDFSVPAAPRRSSRPAGGSGFRWWWPRPV